MSATWRIALATVLLANAGALFAQTTFTNANPITLASTTQKANPYPSNITVSGLSGTLSKVTVTLTNWNDNAANAFPGDRNFVLVGPNGVALKFLAGVGGGNAMTNVTLTLDDSAANSLTSGVTTSGTYKPTVRGNHCAEVPPSPGPATYTCTQTEGTSTFASAYSGINPNGTWALYSYNIPTSDPAGTLSGGWSVTITVAAAANTTTTISSNNNPSFTQPPGNGVTLTATVKKSSDNSAVNEGTVTFKDGATPLSTVAVSNGTATLNTSFTTEGDHALSAVFNGTANFATSTGTMTQNVNNHTTGTSPQFCNTGTVAINSSGTAQPAIPYPQKIFVTGLTGSVSAITMQLPGFTHSFPKDVDMLLVGPNNARFVPLAGIGGGVSVSNVTLTLFDTAASLIPTSGPATGSYQPTDREVSITFPAPAPVGPYNVPPTAGTATFGTTFAGMDPNGTWSLYIYDRAAGDTGSLGGYCLTFTTSSAALTTTTVNSSLNPSFTGNSVTFTANVKSGGNNVTQGSVTFKEGANTLAGPTALDANGNASFSISTLPEGSHVISAFYGGVAGSFNVSSGSVTQIVDTATTVNGNKYCNPGGISLAAGANPVTTPYPSRLFVANRAGVLSGVTLDLSTFTHSFPNDFALLLVGPSGTNIVPWANRGGSTAVSGLNITLSDGAANSLPASSLTSGTFKPTANSSPTFPSPAVAPFNYAAPTGTQTLSTAFNSIDPNGTWTLYAINTVADNGASIGSWCINLALTPPVLAIAKQHAGNFTQGQTGATYTLTVTNNGPGSTAGQVSVVENPPASGLTVTAISGTNWSCTLGTLTCTRSDALAQGSSYEPITVTVNVAANAPASVTNHATVSGGGTAASVQASDVTAITQAADMTISKTHAVTFYQGLQSATYTLTATNIGPGATVGTVTVSDAVPSGLTFVSISGNNWTCTNGTFSCSRSDALAPNTSYDPITVTVNVDANAPAQVTNQATVTGGGEINTGNDTANDVTNIDAAPTVVAYKVLFGSQSYDLIPSARVRVPWQITGIQAVFSKAVTAGTAASLSGVSATGFSGLGTNTLTWTFSPIPLAALSTSLAGSGPNAISDAAGAGLSAGAGFSKAFKVLYGDYNDDGGVSSTDTVGVNNARSAPYNIFADMNGDGVIDITDVQIVRSRLGTSLP